MPPLLPYQQMYTLCTVYGGKKLLSPLSMVYEEREEEEGEETRIKKFLFPSVLSPWADELRKENKREQEFETK